MCNLFDPSGVVYSVALDIANPIDPIDLSIRILNQVVARWCGRSKSRDLL